MLVSHAITAAILLQQRPFAPTSPYYPLPTRVVSRMSIRLYMRQSCRHGFAVWPHPWSSAPARLHIDYTTYAQLVERSLEINVQDCL